ncbi:MAG: glycoside hydrolase family 3 N-terminal domain-containing protein [Verrucomicrobiales bacterium]|nr:glycoside hydrolase family 3 N-terminal domain-containing protein [Verrucomicrobiales bacterium]
MKTRFLNIVLKNHIALAALLVTFNPLVQAAPTPDQRAEALLAQMTLDEKIGQMTQVDMNALHDKADVQKYALGSVLSGGDSDPADNSPAAWRGAVDEFKSYASQTRLKIPLLYGIDAVHGNNNVDGAVIFPHNIGLGATRDAKLVERAAHIAALETRAIGVQWAFAPCIAVAQDARWGRTYESYGESPELVSRLGAAAVRGWQGKQLSSSSLVLACAKHFVGDGGTQDGKNEGNTVCDEATLRRLYLSPYVAAIKAGVGSIMVSFNSWNGKRMHHNKYLLTDVLKGELGFKGFLVSDWDAIDQRSGNYRNDIASSINAGLDMAMVPYGPMQTNSWEKNNYITFITYLKQLVAEGKVPQARIDDAVRRILRVKFQMGLFDQDSADPALLASVGSAEHRQVARECVRESLVLLKNDRKALPLSKKIKHLVVVGQAADDLGLQCGGWTIDWQGKSGNVIKGGTTLLAAIRQTVSAETKITFSADGSGLKDADAVIVVVAEKPYAETKGDKKDLTLAPADLDLVNKARQTGAPVITVLYSGRPLVLGAALESSDAFVAAWLPGTEGRGLTDVLFGDQKPTGKLPRTWPRTNEQLPQLGNDRAKVDAQFPYGFGLSY